MSFHQILLDDWNRTTVDNDRVPALNGILRRIMSNQARYQNVAGEFGTMPYLVVGMLHMRESMFDFTCHLANGDPLSMDTTSVPKGIMAPLLPPYTWEEAALAALENWAHGWNVDLKNYAWTIANTLWFLQAWHGFGAMEKKLPDPYLGNWTNIYIMGDYGSDGVWVPNLVDQNPGCIAVMKIANYLNP